jgi:hypothetical protein
MNSLGMGGQVKNDTHQNIAIHSTPIGGKDHYMLATQPAAVDLTTLCDELRELHRQRQDVHRAEKSLTLQVKAKCRRLCAGDKGGAEKLYRAMFGKDEHPMAFHALAVSAPFIEARKLLEAQRKQTEKLMEKAAKRLPVAGWIESTRGIGIGSLAAIIGEAGNLSNYSNPAKLWKRLGLAVIDGVRQQRRSGAEALEHGYSPSRRSVVWSIGDSMFRAGGYYADLCRERKAYEITKAEAEGLTVVPAAKVPAKEKEKYRSQGHIHNRAKRWMEKRLIRDLWRAWRDIESDHKYVDTHTSGV